MTQWHSLHCTKVTFAGLYTFMNKLVTNVWSHLLQASLVANDNGSHDTCQPIANVVDRVNFRVRWQLVLFVQPATAPGIYSRWDWGQKPPVESRGKAPAGGLGNEVPWCWSSLQTLFTDFDCRSDHNLKISHNSSPDPWPVCFMVGGPSDSLGTKPPSPCLTTLLCVTWYRVDLQLK